MIIDVDIPSKLAVFRFTGKQRSSGSDSCPCFTREMSGAITTCFGIQKQEIGLRGC